MRAGAGHPKRSRRSAIEACRSSTGRVRGCTWLILLSIFLPQPVRAQSIDLELRAGIVVSGALVEDLVANPGLIRRLGESYDGAVRAEPATGLALTVAAATPLRRRSVLDLSVSWTRTRLDAVDASGRREIQDLGAGQAVIGVRYELVRRVEAGCGFGVLRYFADGGLFEGGSDISPLVECGAGVRFGPANRSIVVRATGQTHRFRTPLLRDAGAQSGSVHRLSLQVGIAFGRER